MCVCASLLINSIQSSPELNLYYGTFVTAVSFTTKRWALNLTQGTDKYQRNPGCTGWTMTRRDWKKEGGEDHQGKVVEKERGGGDNKEGEDKEILVKVF